MTTSSDVPLSDAELARIEELATVAHGYGGDEQELGELALELVAEVRAAREREAAGLFELDAVTRVEVIAGRRDYVRRFTEPGAALAVQDDGRTLKVFIDAGGDDDEQ